MKFQFGRRSVVFAFLGFASSGVAVAYLKWRNSKIASARENLGQVEFKPNSVSCESRDAPSLVLIGDSRISRWQPLPAFGPTLVLNKRGIGGENLKSVSLRFRRDAIACNPRGILLQAGINDLVASSFLPTKEADVVVRETIARFISIAVDCSNAGVPLLITTIIPPGRPTKFYLVEGVDSLAALVAEVNIALLAINWPQGVELLDFSSVLLDRQSLTIRREFQDDTLHLSTEGYAALNISLLESSFAWRMRGK